MSSARLSERSVRGGKTAAERPVPRTFGMVGESPAMVALFEIIEKVARHTAHVLITGESGTGKELCARAVHAAGPRAHAPFVAVNCGAIPAQLLESELFGYRRGAFTDAVRDRAGLFEQAHTGTLFLDEIGELPTALQVKLLRALQEGEIRRIGDSSPTAVDVRIVAATARDLAAGVRDGDFREDLFYRLSVLPIEVPALRARKADIPALARHFLRSLGARHEAGATSPPIHIAPEALELLLAHDWPGNVRELENAIERAMVLCDGDTISATVVGERLKTRPPPVTAVQDTGDLSIKKAVRVLERDLICRALARTGGNRTSAAKLLEISHRALLYKIKEYGITP
ncbi:MAG TPA: sigma 54-interacting transcriptional regulator [Kofleriaceae bacterium]|nr:sigma 54-interacting transcriptional regulator [Kofleriaceae bacterium]